MGIALGDGLALAAIVLPVVVATLIRIRVEERALAEAFGERYDAYAAQTDRLIPWLY